MSSQQNPVEWERVRHTPKEGIPRRSKPDEHIIFWELTVFMFSILITKEAQQKRGGCEAGGGKRRERK